MATPLDLASTPTAVLRIIPAAEGPRRWCSTAVGRPDADGVGRELGVNHETLLNWVQALRRECHKGPPAAVSADERLDERG